MVRGVEFEAQCGIGQSFRAVDHRYRFVHRGVRRLYYMAVDERRGFRRTVFEDGTPCIMGHR